MKQDGHRFRVYDDGNVAVVTYHALASSNGMQGSHREKSLYRCLGQAKKGLLRVVHQERDMPSNKLDPASAYHSVWYRQHRLIARPHVLIGNINNIVVAA